jgi:hypothetical protein
VYRCKICKNVDKDKERLMERMQLNHEVHCQQVEFLIDEVDGKKQTVQK